MTVIRGIEPNQYGPLTEEITEAAYKLACGTDLAGSEVDACTREYADLLYDWFVQGFVEGYQYGFES